MSREQLALFDAPEVAASPDPDVLVFWQWGERVADVNATIAAMQSAPADA